MKHGNTRLLETFKFTLSMFLLLKMQFTSILQGKILILRNTIIDI